MYAKSQATPTITTAPRTISMAQSLIFFVISLVINSVGNVLTLVTSAKIHPGFLGSAYWTAATANLANAIGFNLFWAFFIVGILTIILNAILMGHFSLKKALGNLAFMLPFSALIQVFSDFFLGKYATIFAGMPDATTPVMIGLYVALNFVGVALIAIAISIYQRVNLVLHPADDLMQILRFKYFNGHAAKAMWASYIPPTILAVIALVITRSFTNFGLGTIFAFLFQGGITGIADRFVFPKLKHQAVEVSSK
ncbi:fructose permease [Periweissella fabalis]|uniref:Fructose permease n=1 Tax=Periweissella fabalis TaxID=1070421 RepID=A0A7X6S299_9LACO|nr:fructose permease [Periweissella fabalis]MCM0599534.1 fructose permease [Periweissella fabalis]NKZ23839.1 fructose permease [Periweissella fabalis]